MKRANELVELSRRDFCALACLGAGITLTGCFSDNGTGAVQTGGLDGTGNPNAPDSGTTPPTDGSVTGPDAGMSGGTCTGTAFDAGAPSSYTVNTAKQFGSPNYIYVIKDANGFYAMTTRCTHQGVVTSPQGSGASTQMYCPAHGATFSINGSVLGGPTSTPLAHYSMCKLANGNLGVQTSVKVAASVRLVA
jgi:cytochrome b6-f complex iron-sulfur subunit